VRRVGRRRRGHVQPFSRCWFGTSYKVRHDCAAKVRDVRADSSYRILEFFWIGVRLQILINRFEDDLAA
jgi:hypothetical protein